MAGMTRSSALHKRLSRANSAKWGTMGVDSRPSVGWSELWGHPVMWFCSVAWYVLWSGASAPGHGVYGSREAVSQSGEPTVGAWST